MRRSALLSLVAAAMVIIVFLIGFLYLHLGLRTAPVERTDEQNSGSNAPTEVIPPADAPAQLSGEMRN